MDAIKNLLNKASHNTLINQVKSGLICDEAKKYIISELGSGVVKDIASISYVAGTLKIKSQSAPLKSKLKYLSGQIQRTCNTKFGEDCVRLVKI